MLNYLLKIGVLFFAAAYAIFGWTSGNITVDVTNSPMDIKVSAGGKTLAEITALTFGSNKYTTISSSSPTTDALTITINTTTSLTITGVSGGILFKSTNPSISSVTLTLKDLSEHFYGITQHNIKTNPDLRGEATVKDQVAAYQRSDEDAEVYEGFYYTSLGYGAYFDTFAYGVYSFGSSGATTITYNTSAIKWYLFYGPTLPKIQQSLYKVIGAPKKVPIWACGPLVWHDNFTSGTMMTDYASKFVTAQIPYSTMWLDRPYNDGINGWSNMNFEKSSGQSVDFSNPGGWVKSLTDDYYVNLVTWIMPGVFNGGTAPSGAFNSTTNIYLDLTDATQVSWYKSKIKSGQYPYGVKGHKLDRVDNGWVKGDGIVDLPAFSDGTPGPERHKKYAFLNCKVSEELLRVDGGLGDNCFLFPRCAVGGCQKYISAIWNGDTYADWVGLSTSVGNALRAGFLGFPMWGSDICGYKQKSMPGIENYCRWLLFGVYSGFMELMLDGKEPWTLSATNMALVQNIFNQRFNLLPYIYSIINTSADNGAAMMPLVGAYPDDSKTYALTDEYLFGPFMLVAPLTSTSATRSLYLPAGKWINANNYGDEQTGGATITSPTMSLTQIPVYIKSNSVYPTGQVFAGLAKKWDPTYDAKRAIAINAFPGAAGESNSFSYIDYVDANKQKEMAVSVSASNSITVTAPAMTIPGNVVVWLPAAPTSVYLGTTAIASPQYDATAKKLTVPFAANQPIAVTVNGSPTKTLEKFEPVQAHGRIIVSRSENGVELSIPRFTGIGQKSIAMVRIFDAAGRNIVKKEITLKQYSSTPMKTALGNGVYLAHVEAGGSVIASAKIIAP
jgi:alpha-glucosidase (family GH31 glycosyl hydrolase)